jgi:hypothetical protein
MPRTHVIFFKESNGSAPVLEWLQDLRKQNTRAWAKCVERVELLQEFGHELRPPAADFLRDQIHELRVREGRVQYRILYFFHGRNVAILANSIIKESAVPSAEIERALNRKRAFQANPAKHTYDENT